MSQGTAQSLNWDTPGGRLLQKFIAGLPKDRPIVLNVFDSFPLQLKLDSLFVSGDVDLFSDQDFQGLVQSMGLGKGQSDPFLEIVPPNTFIATPVWRDRADRVIFDHVTVYLASPLDILVGKIKRLDPKDLDAFDLVKLKTGGPSEDELRQLCAMSWTSIDRPSMRKIPGEMRRPIPGASGNTFTITTSMWWPRSFNRGSGRARPRTVLPRLRQSTGFVKSAPTELQLRIPFASGVSLNRPPRRAPCAGS